MSRFYTIHGEVLDCGIAEARKAGHLPSVTSLISAVFPKDGLRPWLDEQLVKACLSIPKGKDEDFGNYMANVRMLADTKRDTAADFGSRLHDAIEMELKLWPRDAIAVPFNEPGELYGLSGWTQPFMQWVDDMVEEVVWTEKVLTSGHGFAGRADARVLMKNGKVGLLDFKNQGFKEGRCNWYKEYRYQLSAYSHATEFESLNSSDMECYSIVFNRDEPGMPKIRLYSLEEMHESWLTFQSGLEFWKRLNNFFTTYPLDVDNPTEKAVSPQLT